MKITFLLTQDLYSPAGGRYFPWAKELVKLGNDVHVVALHPDFTHLSKKKESMEGVKIDYVAQMHVKKIGNLKTYFSPFQLVWIAARATINLSLAAFKYPVDLIIVGKPYPMNSIAAFILKFFKPKTIIIVDCDDIETSSNRFQNNWQKRIVDWFEKKIPRAANFVTSNTFYNIHRLEENGVPPEKIFYFPNGIDPERFSETKTAEVNTLRSTLGLNGKKVISFIGSLSLTNHPVDLLVYAFSIVHQSIPESVLLFVGGGEDMERLIDLTCEYGVNRYTIFIGKVPPNQVPYYYQLSDVTVDPVFDDEVARGRCPLKLFEAWASGVPFVTADVGDRQILIGNPPAGLLVSQGDEKALADGLLQLLGKPDLGNNLRYRGLLEVKNYWWSILTTKFNDKFIVNRQ